MKNSNEIRGFYYVFGDNVWIRIPKNGTFTLLSMLNLKKKMKFLKKAWMMLIGIISLFLL